MKRIEKIKILKAIAALLLFIGVPILLFYLGVVVPEYCACDETMYEGQKGIDIWGDMVYCDAESQDFAKAFFQLLTMVILVFSAILALIYFLIYRIKKK
ncbi:MAG: hypothetical protein E2600_11805 [Chryseobacterium sp.]|nr:hypothetical protein [Chryseobacterium sp.]